MNVVIVTPPLVQLNCPYPAGGYLKGFFKEFVPELGKNEGQACVKWMDLNIELFHAVFCADGLRRLFELNGKKVLQLVAEAEKEGEPQTDFTEYYKSCQIQEEKGAGYEYLKSRGINLNTIKKYKLGFSEKWKNPK